MDLIFLWERLLCDFLTSAGLQTSTPIYLNHTLSRYLNVQASMAADANLELQPANKATWLLVAQPNLQIGAGTCNTTAVV